MKLNWKSRVQEPGGIAGVTYYIFGLKGGPYQCGPMNTNLIQQFLHIVAPAAREPNRMRRI